MKTALKIEQVEVNLWRGQFEAMKSPCEVWLETENTDLAQALIEQAQEEALRIQNKYSRFEKESFLSYLNSHPDIWLEVDEETDALFNFADQCWQLTEGWIDVTVGAFFKLWRFDGKTKPPTRKQIEKVRPYVGWKNIKRKPGQIWIPKGFQIDFGGIGKEYAVDKVANMLALNLDRGGIMVNFGGDINAMRPRNNQQPWRVVIESINNTNQRYALIEIFQGAIATSGTTKRFVVNKRGKPLGHILNPKTGWPVNHGPASVTVLGKTATQSGLLATLAMLKGKQAEAFLEAESVQYYCQRTE